MNRMKVAEFQIQLQSGQQTAQEILQTFDPNAPIPQALEGGNGNGPLYQCVLNATDVNFLRKFCDENPDVIFYTEPHVFELADSLYRPDFYVHWQMGASPTVSEDPW